MNEVDAMVEDITPFRSGQSGTGKFAVNRVEKGHEPSGSQSESVMSAEEQEKRGEHQDASECRDNIGSDSRRCQSPGNVKRRNRPEALGDDIGGALVGSHETAPFDVALVSLIDHKSVRHFAFAQFLPECGIEAGGGADEERWKSARGISTPQKLSNARGVRSGDMGRDG